MTRYGMVIDTKKCIGCHVCAMACKTENNLPNDVWWNRIFTDNGGEMGFDMVGGSYPDNLQFGYVPVACQHCENPQCVSVCPTGASYRREDGIVLVDHAKCVGCQYCVMACPYGVRTYDTAKDKGVIEKCTLCAHLVDDDKTPACVRHCPGQARFFGDADDPESDVSKMIARKQTHKLTDVGNKPSVTFGLDKCEWKGGE